ncbi:MAG: hypothetical protein BGO31_03530 [Bacteroidetes bacterium 43-16]|nr:MAG: hypothetical protein BGO31_03530 [Bacteroidetes bacterium 43-16]
MKKQATVTLYWPVNHDILESIEATGCKRFPDSFLCNPVLNEGYAVQISQELDAATCPIAYICEFELDYADLEKFSIKQSPNIYHQELEMDKDNLQQLNDAISGCIRVKRVFKKWMQDI